MKFAFEVGDRARSVDVQRHSDALRVMVDGRPHLVDAVRIDGQTWSLLVRDEEQGTSRSVEAVVVPQPAGGVLDIYIDGHRIPVGLPGGFGRRTRQVEGASGAGPQRVIAPMPGKIVRVLVQPGDQVKARQGLVVVEAMKMENELRSAREGRVRDVFVREGQSVEAGTALVVVE